MGYRSLMFAILLSSTSALAAEDWLALQVEYSSDGVTMVNHVVAKVGEPLTVPALDGLELKLTAARGEPGTVDLGILMSKSDNAEDVIKASQVLARIDQPISIVEQIDENKAELKVTASEVSDDMAMRAAKADNRVSLRVEYKAGEVQVMGNVTTYFGSETGFRSSDGKTWELKIEPSAGKVGETELFLMAKKNDEIVSVDRVTATLGQEMVVTNTLGEQKAQWKVTVVPFQSEPQVVETEIVLAKDKAAELAAEIHKMLAPMMAKDPRVSVARSPRTSDEEAGGQGTLHLQVYPADLEKIEEIAKTR
jgi:hypothetical protein